jgi:hypothetical protein
MLFFVVFKYKKQQLVIGTLLFEYLYPGLVNWNDDFFGILLLVVVFVRSRELHLQK